MLILDHIIDNKFIFPTVGYFDIILKHFNNDKRVILNDFLLKNMYIPSGDLVLDGIKKKII